MDGIGCGLMIAKYSRAGKYMHLSLNGSSHFPVSVLRSQFRAIVPSERSVIIQNANQRNEVISSP